MPRELVKAPESLSVWTSNMKELVARQPKLASVLHGYVLEHGHEFAHFENRTPSGVWVEGLSDEPFFQSNDDPEVEWTKKSRDVPVFFQYGIGVPPYVFKVIRTLPEEALSLIVAEPNVGLLAYVLHMTHVYLAMPKGATLTFLTTPKEVSEGIKLIKDEGDSEALPLDLLTRIVREEAMETNLNVHGLFTVMLSKTSIHDGEQQAIPDEFTEMAKFVREWLVVRLSFLGNSPHDTMLGLRQMALMSPWIVYGYQYESLLEEFKGRPFVVVSAGPSLQKNYELLRDIQDKCVILANDAVLHKLLIAGIRPHIVCALERGIETYDWLFKDSVREYPEECAEILLVDQAVCTPMLFGTWPGPKIIVGKNEIPVDKWFIAGTIHGRIIPSGSSVAHMCLGVAETMGASSVALIGQDLAYGEGGVSHASDIMSEDVLKGEARPADGSGVFRVPGSLGGEVETSHLWLSFLRLFEARIAVSSIPIFDCTEGGALIKGTHITPFAEYIAEHIAGLDEFEITPAAVVARDGLLSDKESKFGFIAPFFQKAEQDLDESISLIADIAESLDLVSSAAILPKKRVLHAAKTAAMMDKLNALNPMFAFIAQSYLYLSTAEIAVTRFLDDVETVERWVTVHREIVEAHVAIARFIKTWLDYSWDAIAYYSERDLPVAPIGPDESYVRFKEICETLDGEDDPDDPDAQIFLRCETDALLTLTDAAQNDWPGEALWQCAMFLLKEGRSQEAGVLMKAAESYFDDTEMPVDQICAFLKDYARVLMTPDLCYYPDNDYAKLLIENAVGLCGEDAETEALRAELHERRMALFIDYGTTMSSYRKEFLEGWYAERKKAEDAMSRSDAMAAMKIVWNAVREYGRHVPKIAAPYLIWLMRNMEKFFGTDDENCKPVIDAILDDMASRMAVLRDVPVPVTVTFMNALSEHGANIEVSSPARKEAESL